MESALDGARGFVFISHAGDVRASEFLPLSAGNLRYRPLDAIYRGSDLFVALRDPNNLQGKCGRCEFRHICGGSRARAWNVDGNVFADDPLCAYEPGLVMPLPTAVGSAKA
jgi:radical SAM protein with 4Fe4S-binding SPASM domain